LRQRENILEEYLQWCRAVLLPFWLKHGIDTKHGGFFETLHMSANANRESTRRVRVASRQVYSFSHGHHLQWIEAKRQILNGVDWLMDRAWAKDGEPGFLHIVDDNSQPLDHTRDLYDHAFHILGLSWAYRATKDAQILSVAEQAWYFIEDTLAAKNGGWYENLQQTQIRRQNPHMHMFEALLSMFEVTKDTAYLIRADDIAQLLLERFIDQKSGYLFEEFNNNWTAMTPARIEPGHMMEWTWLLHQRAQIPAKTATTSCQINFLQHGENLGRQENGLLIDSCDPNGDISQHSSRLWVQCEWLKALLTSNDQSQNLDQKANDLCERLFTYFINQDHPALWMDAVSKNNQPLSNRVPASIVYHLVSAAAQVEQFLSQPQTLESSCPSL